MRNTRGQQHPIQVRRFLKDDGCEYEVIQTIKRQVYGRDDYLFCEWKGVKFQVHRDDSGRYIEIQPITGLSLR